MATMTDMAAVITNDKTTCAECEFSKQIQWSAGPYANSIHISVHHIFSGSAALNPTIAESHIQQVSIMEVMRVNSCHQR